VVTSEPYGEYLAEFMDIKYLNFDPEREHYPISSSLLREDLLNYWRYLLPSVQREFQKTIVVLGTESTGKTTLCQQLADHFNAPWVKEVGRETIPDSKCFSLYDLELTAKYHAQSIIKAKMKGFPIVVVDTDIYTTI